MPTDYATKFVTYIAEAASKKPAARTAMRAGLGRPPAQCAAMHTYLTRWIPENTHPNREAAHYTIASLIGHTPDSAIPDPSPGNLGSSMAQAAQSAATTEKALHLLTRQSSSTICRYLVTTIVPLRNARVPVDFARLLDDLSGWPWRQKETGKQWLQAYYRHHALTEKTA